MKSNDSCPHEMKSWLRPWLAIFIRVVDETLSVTEEFLAWTSAEIFPGEGKVDILLMFFRLLAMQRKWTYTKKKMSNVTAAVACSVFLVRKLYSEQMFVLVSMDFLRLSGVPNELLYRLCEFLELLQPLRWCCVDCMIHHERDVSEEQKYMYVARTKQ